MRTRKVRSGMLLRHTKSAYHNSNEKTRWEKITGKSATCCVKLRKKIPRGVNKGKPVGPCSELIVGAHIRFDNSNKLYIVPVCNRHNDTGWKSSPFLPGSWFESKSTTAVPATDRSPKKRSGRKKSMKKSRRKKIKMCQRKVKRRGRCHQHKHKRRARKNVRKGICGAKLT